jgi:carboxymethylenebutenolidase
MDVRIPIPTGGEMPAYLSLPVKPTAGVVVIQEIFGVTPAMKAICDGLAARQFVALCPDIYWRTDPGAVISESEGEKARACRAKVDDNQASDDIAVAVDWLRQHSSVNAGVGVVGFCWGGLLAYLTATRHKPDAAASYYGVGIEKRLDEATNLACPMLIHYAELDKFSPPEVVAQVKDKFHDDPRVTVRTYPNADHAFARPGGHNFNAKAADLAGMRTLSFFVDRLIGRR